jgi:nicotinate-nucleotide adenylyltransferase
MADASMPELPARVCLFGGSFDPPHLGHILATQWALSMLEVDEVAWVPAWRHAFAKNLTRYDHRLGLARIAVTTLGSRVTVRDWEREFETTYTADLLRQLTARYPGRFWTLLVGADVYLERSAWREWETIESLASVAVIGRTGYDAPEAGGVELPDISSTVIRTSLSHGGTVAAQWVPPAVLAEIRRLGLYRLGP